MPGCPASIKIRQALFVTNADEEVGLDRSKIPGTGWAGEVVFNKILFFRVQNLYL